MTTIMVPKIKAGQKVREWAKDFLSSTALLEEKQQLAILPLYVDRSAGEKELACIAGKQTTIKDALKELGDLIDGKPNRLEASQEFFNMNIPVSPSVQEQISYYFNLQKAGEEADIPSDVIILKFLSTIPRGNKIFKEVEKEMKPDMDESEILDLFKKLQPQLKLKEGSLGSKENVPNEEVYYDEEQEPDEGSRVPGWVDELKEELQDLKSRVDYIAEESGSSKEQDESYYSTNRKAKPNSSSYRGKICRVCKKKGHEENKCWYRECKNCGGKGHSERECPSNKNKYPPYSKKDSRKPL